MSSQLESLNTSNIAHKKCKKTTGLPAAVVVVEAHAIYMPILKELLLSRNDVIGTQVVDGEWKKQKGRE
jgi:hypothetical protein